MNLIKFNRFDFYTIWGFCILNIIIMNIGNSQYFKDVGLYPFWIFHHLVIWLMLCNMSCKNIILFVERRLYNENQHEILHLNQNSTYRCIISFSLIGLVLTILISYIQLFTLWYEYPTLTVPIYKEFWTTYKPINNSVLVSNTFVSNTFVSNTLLSNTTLLDTSSESEKKWQLMLSLISIRIFSLKLLIELCISLKILCTNY